MIPMLARTYGPKYSKFPCYCQPKLNGIRALYQAGVFQSRDEKLWKPHVLEHLVSVLHPYRDILKGVILDGELYRHGWRLQRINSAVAVNRIEPTLDTPHVSYCVFDVVDPKRKFSERWFEIYGGLIAAQLPGIVVVPTAVCYFREEIEQHFHHFTALGYEGIMLRPDGPYEFGETPHHTTKRSEFLWKHKSWTDSEFLCVGITTGEGKAAIGIGALTVESSPGINTKVGTGYSDEDRTAFFHNPPIGKMIKVRYLEKTADGRLFNPSFLCVM